MKRLFPLRVWSAILAVAALLLVVLPVLHLAVPDSSPLHVSSFWITLVGKFMCYAPSVLSFGAV